MRRCKGLRVLLGDLPPWVTHEGRIFLATGFKKPHFRFRFHD